MREKRDRKARFPVAMKNNNSGFVYFRQLSDSSHEHFGLLQNDRLVCFCCGRTIKKGDYEIYKHWGARPQKMRGQIAN